MAASRFERLRDQGKLDLDDAGAHRAWRAIRRRHVVRIAGLLVMLLGLGSTYLDQPRRPEREPLIQEQVRALSDVIRTADLVGGHGPRVLDAEADGFTWDHMEPEERDAEGRVLARELKRQLSIDSAMLRREGKLVLLIQRGRVVFVARGKR